MCFSCFQTSVLSRQTAQYLQQVYIYKVVISVCLFVCPIITQEPMDHFASKFDWGNVLAWFGDSKLSGGKSNSRATLGSIYKSIFLRLTTGGDLVLKWNTTLGYNCWDPWLSEMILINFVQSSLKSHNFWVTSCI